MRPELLPQLQRPGIAGQRLLISLLARRAAADEKAAAAIVFVIAVEVGNAPDLPGPRIAAAVKFPVDHDACAHARPEGDANHVAVSVRLAETADAQRKAVAVVVYRNRHAEPLLETLLEMHLPPGGNADHVVNDSPFCVHHRRNADADTLYVGRNEPFDKRSYMVQNHLLGTIRPARLGKHPHNPTVSHQSHAHVRTAQIYSDSHRSTAISVIFPSAKRA